MPPLGRTLMGLWASEAYSFHPVSTSRFPSILFHNTPGDVYVLQDARKMRSRLHSDIGRFTASDEGWARGAKKEPRGERAGELDETNEENGASEQSLRGRSSWDLRGRPDYFSHRRSAVFYGPNDADHALSRVHILTCATPTRNSIPKPRGPRSFSRELDALYLPGTERETNYSKIARR